MRKFAMTTIAAATLLVGGLTGCGVDNQAGDMGGGAFRGAGTGTGHAPTADHRGMTGARYTGEGPITDMFTRDDRTGQGGAGANGIGGGVHGGHNLGGGPQDRHGLGNRTMAPGTAGQNAAGLTGQDARRGGTGLFGNQNAGQQGTGLFGNQGANQRGTGLFGNQNAGQRGGGLFGQDAGNRGTGLFGTQRGTTTGNELGARGRAGAGITGQMGERGMAGVASETGHPRMTGNQGRTGATGITGNRPGMVDDQGILRGQRAGHQNHGVQGQNHTTRGLTGDRTGRSGQAGQQAGQNNQVQQIKQIVDRTENVNNSHVVVHGDSVMIGIESNGQDTQAIQNKIKQNVEREVQGLDVYVITDREQVNQLRTMNERLQNGGTGAMDEIGSTVTEMTRDLGRAAQRPFERTR